MRKVVCFNGFKTFFIIIYQDCYFKDEDEKELYMRIKEYLVKILGVIRNKKYIS